MSKKSEPMQINAAVLKWARETAGYKLPQMKKDFPKLLDWENGALYPTYKQLERLAKKYQRPPAIFFFPEPPKEEPIEKSLRAVAEVDLASLSPKIRFLFRDAKRFQIYLKELCAHETQEQLSKIAWLKENRVRSPEILAEEIRKLFIPLEKQWQWKNDDQALKEWRNILAQKGVYVFKDSFKESGAKESSNISGFCIYDELFPVIFVNNAQSHNWQIFTIFHELAHLIFKQNYLDILDINENFWRFTKENSLSDIEAKCDAFAGSFLVPKTSLADEFTANVNDSEKLARHYKVSEEVILRKLFDNHIINKQTYEEKIAPLKSAYDKSRRKKTSGGDYYATKLSYLGKAYVSLILQQHNQERIDLEQAAEYLDIKVKSFPQLEKKYLEQEASRVPV